MTRKKCRILDCVLDTFPEHLKTKARVCATPWNVKPYIYSPQPRNFNWRRSWPRKQHTGLHYGFINWTTSTRNTQIHDARKREWKIETELSILWEIIGTSAGVSRCRKFESIIDGTVDRCDFSDDTNSDESNKDNDTDEDEDNDEDDYTDGTEEDDEEESWTKMNIMNLPRRERKIDWLETAGYVF